MTFVYSLVAQLCLIIYIYMGVVILKKCMPSKETHLIFALCISAGFLAFCNIFAYTEFLPFRLFNRGFYEFWTLAKYLSIYSLAPIMLHIILCKSKPAFLLKYNFLNCAIYFPALFMMAVGSLSANYYKRIGINTPVSFHILNCTFYGIGILLLLIIWRRSTGSIREEKQIYIISYCGILTFVLAIAYKILRMSGFHAPDFAEGFLLIIILGIWLAITRYSFVGIAELIKSEEIIEKVNDFVFIADCKNNIIKVNKSLLANLGFIKSELIGNQYFKLFNEDFNASDFFLGNNDDSTYECDMVTASGNSIPVVARPKIIRDLSGDTAGLLVICKDIRIVRELQVEVSQRMKKEMQLNYLGMHDALTGLHNRTYFEQEIQKLEQSGRKTIGIMICDVDGLKIINDTLGHVKGDELLKTTTRLLLDTRLEKIVIARIGGDEFALILPDCTPEQLCNEENRIRDSVEQYNSKNKGIPLSISTGSAFTSDRRKSIYTLYKEADNNMYMEKLSHKGSVRNITIQALSNMMKARDFTTQDHIDRMGELANVFGIKAGLSAEQLNTLGLLVQFHDIGKVGIPDNILFKPAPLTSEEMEEMKKHSEIGYKIAFATPDIAPVAEFILKHHERWDGTGYVLGLKGNKIPLECRLLSIIDAFDAMTNDRPYRKAMDIDFALKEIAQNAGTQFDPELAYLFIEMVTKGRLLMKKD